ncbi:MAG: hypothetical protein Q3959_06065 [Limosilactobacillus sp.]|uniref:hypothetical protein n=1 Tax=Limosilactobacillus sp. TaxID=2773925 RepID=UPI0027014E3D|nr:hypothetical protein [Limosilactobacillus sp.]
MLGDSLEETEFDNSRSREATAQDLCAMGYVVDLSSGYPSELVYTENGAEDVGAFDSLFGTPAGKAHDERERKSSSWF